MDPYYTFLQAKKDLEKLHNDYATKMRQEFVRFSSEVKQLINGMDDIIAEKVKNEMETHIPILHQAVKNISEKAERLLGK